MLREESDTPEVCGRPGIRGGRVGAADALLRGGSKDSKVLDAVHENSVPTLVCFPYLDQW